MNLKDKLYYMPMKTKIILCSTVIVVLGIIIGLLILKFTSPKEEVEVEQVITETISKAEDTIKESEEIQEAVPQDETINMISGTVEEINDIGSQIFFKVGVSRGKEIQTVTLVINSDTALLREYDYNRITPLDIAEGDKIVSYIKGDATKNTKVTAEVIVLGNTVDFSYGKVTNIKISNDDIQIWSLADTNDCLYVNSNTCSIIDTYTGIQIGSLKFISSMDKVLYKYAPDFDITQNGNQYHCTEILVFTD